VEPLEHKKERVDLFSTVFRFRGAKREAWVQEIGGEKKSAERKTPPGVGERRDEVCGGGSCEIHGE